jgi:hypothetical protein
MGLVAAIVFVGEDIACPGEYEIGMRAPSAKSEPVLCPKKLKTTNAVERESLSRPRVTNLIIDASRRARTHQRDVITSALACLRV